MPIYTFSVLFQKRHKLNCILNCSANGIKMDFVRTIESDDDVGNISVSSSEDERVNLQITEGEDGSDKSLLILAVLLHSYGVIRKECLLKPTFTCIKCRIIGTNSMLYAR